MSAHDVLQLLTKVKRTGDGQWIACCPAHEDRSPSMTIKELSDGRVLIHDFAGCSVDEILGVLGLEFDVLFPEKDPESGANFEGVEVGDTFACVFYMQYSRGISSAPDLKVIRAGKRDVFCKPVSYDGREIKFTRKGLNRDCYPLGHEKVLKAREEIRFANRSRRCLKIMEANRNNYDDELMDAIEAFDFRIKEVKS